MGQRLQQQQQAATISKEKERERRGREKTGGAAASNHNVWQKQLDDGGEGAQPQLSFNSSWGARHSAAQIAA